MEGQRNHLTLGKVKEVFLEEEVLKEVLKVNKNLVKTKEGQKWDWPV